MCGYQTILKSGLITFMQIFNLINTLPIGYEKQQPANID
jgi:hypothetical protein